jgi:hypothetical protein
MARFAYAAMAVCFLFHTHVLVAHTCFIFLRQTTFASPSETHKRAYKVEGKKVTESWAHERALAKEEGLALTYNSSFRSESEIDAWHNKISARLKAAGTTESDRMPIEEFLGLIDAAYSRHDFRLGELFKEYGVEHVRFTHKENFQTEIKSKGAGTNEIILTIPNQVLDKPIDLALWSRDLHLALYQAARLQMIAKLESLPPLEAKHLWESQYKKKLKKLDTGVSNYLSELNHYLTLKLGKDEAKELMNLPEESLSYSKIYLARGWLQTLTPFTAPLTGGLAESINTLIGVKHPLKSYEPSKLWLAGKESLMLEEAALDQRMNYYFQQRRGKKVVGMYLSGMATLGLAGIGYLILNSGEALTEIEDGFGEEKEKLDELNLRANFSIDNLKEDDLKSLYEEYNRKAEKASKEGKPNAALYYAQNAKKVLIKLKGMDLDGF